jgi:hypothetical protein
MIEATVMLIDIKAANLLTLAEEPRPVRNRLVCPRRCATASAKLERNGGPPNGGPAVRIHFPPAESQTNFRSLGDGEMQAWLTLECNWLRAMAPNAVQATPANVADSTVLPDLLHGNETNPRVGRPGVSRPAGSDPPARAQGAGLHQSPLPPSRCGGRGRAREKPDQIEGAGQEPALAKAGVEHPIGVILLVTCALVNLFMARRHLLRGDMA